VVEKKIARRQQTPFATVVCPSLKGASYSKFAGHASDIQRPHSYSVHRLESDVCCV